MKIKTLKKKLLIASLGLGIALNFVGTASANYCSMLEAQCAINFQDSCVSLRFYCVGAH
jgi:hypothetical protein